MKFGIDALVEDGQGRLEPLVRRAREGSVGLLAHAASVDRRLRHAVDVLLDLGVKPTTLFGPEHGFGAAAQDMIGVGHAVDEKTGARVVSLYGDSEDDLVPKPADLEPLDLLIVDLADVGARYYTYVWTALLAARRACEAGCAVVILDRPNPIGDLVEGRTQDEGFLSFVGLEPVPVRHGLTLAEMVCLHLQAEGQSLGPEEGVSVVAVEGLSRQAHAPSWDRPFVLPSPNMPSYETALVYPGGCLLEGTNLSEGRGHTRPFEFFGAPFVAGERLAKELEATGLEGFVARPVAFIPTFHKHGSEVCGGVQIHVTEPALFRPVAVYTAAIALCHHQDPSAFRFRTERYEFIDDIPAFDLLTGSAQARLAIEAGESARDVAEAVSAVDPDWSGRVDGARRALRHARW